MKRHYSLEEYIEAEKTSEDRHSFYQGEVSALSGGTLTHAKTIGNTLAELQQLLSTTPCRPLMGNMRISTPSGLYTYPDISAFCGDPELTDDQCTLLNPVMLIEVLSPATKNYDRGDKFLHYRSINSLQDYLLIDSESIHIEHYQRQNENEWLLHEYRDVGEQLHLKSIDKILLVTSLYQQITF